MQELMKAAVYIVLALCQCGFSQAVDPLRSVALNLKSANRVGSLSLTVKEAGTRKVVTEQTNFYKTERSYAHGKTIASNIANLSRDASPPAIFDVIWFSQAMENKAVGVSERTCKQLPQIKGGGVHAEESEMPALASRPAGFRNATGAKFYGWAVMIRFGSDVVALKTSSPSVEALVRDGAKLGKMLSDFERNRQAQPVQRF